MNAARPDSFSVFHGQRAVVDHLQVAVRASLRQQKPLGHVLLTGPRGLGKTTLGNHVLPSELGTTSVYINCAAIEKPQDLLPTLTTMQAHQVLFLDEIHRLPAAVTEHLYSVMEDGKLTVVIGEDRQKKVISVDLDPFVVVAATTREGLLSDPLRDRFKHRLRLDLYSDIEMEAVLGWIGARRGVMFDSFSGQHGEIHAEVLLIPACHGTARHAVNLIDACTDTLHGDSRFAELADRQLVTREVIEATLVRLGFDRHGLSRGERELLTRLAHAPKKMMGLATLATILDEEDATIEEVYEPWLLRCGLIAKTPGGRMLTDDGLRALEAA